MQSFAIFLAILLGFLLPFAHELTFLIRYFLMTMLFFSFLKTRFEWKVLHRHHLWVLLLNFGIPLGAFALLQFLDRTLALAAFIIAVAPTAAVAPVIAGFLRSRVEFVTASVILTSPVVAVALPFLLPLLMEVDSRISAHEMLFPVVILVFGPLLASRLFQSLAPRWTKSMLRWPNIPFYLFLLNVHIASADATIFIRQDAGAGWPALLQIALVVGAICLIQFQIGERLDGGRLRYETGLSLGRKNTMFGLWVALTYINPVVAMGPVCYIFWQNLYNGWQMWQVERSQTKNDSLI